MGSHKDQMERGWLHVNAYICPDCIEDSYLQSLIVDSASSAICSYCKAESSKPIAAEVDLVLEKIYSAITRRFDDPSSASVPYEGGFLVDSTDTMDVLHSLSLECSEDFKQDIVDSIVNTSWVEAPGGNWLNLEKSKSLFYSWENFSQLVRHQIRYFFLHKETDEEEERNPENIGPSATLESIASLARTHGLIRPVSKGISLFRVRVRSADETWSLNGETLGAPPEDIARAGRMNPAGIPYLYLAFDEETAMTEVKSTEAVAVGVFSARQDILVLDLASLPDIPSVFDEDNYEDRQEILFLHSFVDAIQEPIEKDGREHVEYVPTQIVSEYFSHIFKTEDGKPIDGIVYPSSVHHGGVNLVLFPPPRFSPFGENRVDFSRGYIRDFNPAVT